MPWSCLSLCPRVGSWLRDYDRVQALAVHLIYVQIGCALIGSLGALFNGVLVINLVVSLFALVAIESSSQALGRIYAVLLGCSIILDVFWFILFSRTIWNTPPQDYGTYFVFSLRITLLMQVIGFSIRFLSTFLWIQMYRLGVPNFYSTLSREADFDVRKSFLNPATREISRQNSTADAILGGSYNPTYLSSLFDDTRDKSCINEVGNHIVGHSFGCKSNPEASRTKTLIFHRDNP